MTTDIAEADSTDLTLADQVRARLERDGLRPEEAADAIGIPTARLIALLQGAPPNFSTQRKVEAWLAIESTAAPEAAAKDSVERDSERDQEMADKKAYLEIPLSQIMPNPKNPRRIDDSHPSLPELAESMKPPIGVIEPVVVVKVSILEHPKEAANGINYKLLAGERRWRAARIAGLSVIPAILRDVDADTAFAITVIENLKREGLHWMEEARAIVSMRERGHDVETIAAEISKSAAWVATRLKLTKMSPKWLAAFDDPKSGFHLWPIVMIEQIARLPVTAQDELLADNSYEWDQVQSSDALKKHIEKHYLLRLQSAPWALDDAKLLPKAGACSACPKRSSCQTNLFDQAGGERCTDRTCWAAKDIAYTKRRISDARTDQPGIKVLFEEGHSGDDMKELGVTEKDLLNGWGWEDCKEGDKGAVAAVCVDGSKRGKVVYKRKSPGARHEAAKRSSSSLSPAEKAKRATALLEAKRNEYVIEAFNSALKKQRDCPGKIDARALLALSVSWGLYPMGAGDQSKVFLAHAHRPIDELMDVVWRSFVTAFADNYEGMSGDAVLAAATTIVKHFDEAWPERLQGWTAEALKKFPAPVAAADKPEKRKAYVKETASGVVRTHDHNYSALLKKKLAADGLSLQRAAKAIGVSVPALRTAIIGKNQPNARTAGKYCKFLGIDLGEAKAAKAGAA